MRARDVRAITFCIVSSLALMGAALLIVKSYVVSLALTAAYVAWLLSRPRMQRVLHRLRGDPDWSGYFSDKPAGIKPKPGPGTAAPSPHPVERR